MIDKYIITEKNDFFIEFILCEFGLRRGPSWRRFVAQYLFKRSLWIHPESDELVHKWKIILYDMELISSKLIFARKHCFFLNYNMNFFISYRCTKSFDSFLRNPFMYDHFMLESLHVYICHFHTRSLFPHRNVITSRRDSLVAKISIIKIFMRWK